jgi:hypothetical protein
VVYLQADPSVHEGRESKEREKIGWLCTMARKKQPTQNGAKLREGSDYTINMNTHIMQAMTMNEYTLSNSPMEWMDIFLGRS